MEPDGTVFFLKMWREFFQLARQLLPLESPVNHERIT